MEDGRRWEETHEQRNARKTIATMMTTRATHRPQLFQPE
jgi:hypothetical protein